MIIKLYNKKYLSLFKNPHMVKLCDDKIYVIPSHFNNIYVTSNKEAIIGIFKVGRIVSSSEKL